MTTPSAVIERIHALCANDVTDFVTRTTELYSELDALNDREILLHIEVGGMIPEDIRHDSSEEKLFAKYCDYLLARGLTLIGISSQPIPDRADAADVQGTATVGSERYRIVGDAKAFRLSRTAKNQKDFKVDALNRWKRGAEFAVLLSPMYQYPTRTSQIYLQAIQHTVTLLSFAHLGFLVTHRAHINEVRLMELWSKYNTLPPTKDAVAYWAAIDELVCAAVDQPSRSLVDYLAEILEKVRHRAGDQLTHWRNRKIAIEQMPIEDLRARLLAAERIESNIATISGFIENLERAANLNSEVRDRVTDG